MKIIEDKVKEFIRILKEETKVGTNWYRLGFHRLIDKRAGGKLV